ncbi:MAG: chromate transporter, partial [Clostridia bacterium]|nr:chromate transporter [Clostridia bacterium]
YNFIGVSESTPGAISLNLATFVGTSQGGALGGIIATVAVVIPSFVIILLIMKAYTRFNKSKYTKAIMSGIQPVVLALILVTGLFIAINNFAVNFGDWNAISLDYRALLIMGILGAVLLVVNVGFKKFLSPIILIIISAGIGMLIY